MKEISIRNKKIGENNPCFIIAEAGANHEGSVEKACKLIDAVKKSGADSIKFQTYKASELTTRNAPKYWDDGIENESQFDVFKKLDSFENDDWKQVFEFAQKKDIICFSTPFDEKSVDLLYSLNVPAFKIASADITHIPLIKKVASKDLPIFLSTGMATNQEMKEAVDEIENCGNQEIVLLHCITSYPTKPEDANLEMIRTLKNDFPNYVIGYSDHTLGTLIPALSIDYGSKVVEKHFTYDTNLTVSRDHRLSLDENSFREMIENIRIAEISKGESRKDGFDTEKEGVKYARRSIVSTEDIPEGTTISRDMLAVKRPGTGIYPKFMDKIIGSKTTKKIAKDVPLQWDDVSE